jgi:hypothetical protein
LDGLISVCNRVWISGQREPLDSMWSERILGELGVALYVGTRRAAIAVAGLANGNDLAAGSDHFGQIFLTNVVGNLDPANGRMAELRPQLDQRAREARRCIIKALSMADQYSSSQLMRRKFQEK